MEVVRWSYNKVENKHDSKGIREKMKKIEARLVLKP